MSPPIHNAAARQNSGEPLSVVGQTSDRSNGWRSLDMTAESEIAGLADRPTHELRLAWRKLYRREPPVGLSRDLMIRALANKLQERTHGRPSLAPVFSTTPRSNDGPPFSNSPASVRRRRLIDGLGPP